MNERKREADQKRREEEELKVRKYDVSGITHETNYMAERKKIIEELHRVEQLRKLSIAKEKPSTQEKDPKRKTFSTKGGSTRIHEPSGLFLTSRHQATESSKAANKIEITDGDEQQSSSEHDEAGKDKPDQEAERNSRKLAQQRATRGHRARDFKLKIFTRKNMFEGFSFFQYDQYTLRDTTMQKVVLRDQLIILIGKANTLKDEVYDEHLTRKVPAWITQVGKAITLARLKKMNVGMEEVMAILDGLVKLLLFGKHNELIRHPGRVRQPGDH